MKMFAEKDHGESCSPTPEREAHATAAALEIEIRDEFTPSGQPTGRKHRRIEHPLDAALRRGWITREMHDAGERFRVSLMGARLEPRVTGSYGDRVFSRSDEAISDVRLAHMNRLMAAMSSIHRNLRAKFFDWMLSAEKEDVNVSSLGEKFTTMRHGEAVKSAGVLILSMVLEDLAVHYGMSYTAEPQECTTEARVDAALCRT